MTDKLFPEDKFSDKLKDPFQVPELRNYAISSLVIVPDAQRILVPSKVEDIKANFTWVKWSPPIVTPILDAQSQDSGLANVVGHQHGVTALFELNPEVSIDCIVVEGLTRQEQSALGHDLNWTDLKPKPLDEWRSRVAAGEVREVAAEAWLANHGIKVTAANSFDQIGSPAKIMGILNKTPDSLGPANFYWIINTLRGSYTHSLGKTNTNRFGAVLLEALNQILIRNNREVDQSRMVKILKSNSLETWLKTIPALGKSSNLSPVDALGRALVDKYNSGLKLEAKTNNYIPRIKW